MNQKINSEIHVKATAALEEEVKKELLVKDPSEEKAKAILNNEDTTGNDARNGS